MKKLITVLCLICAGSSVLSAQDNSVLANGDWYKLSVTQNGVYKIDRNFLANIGIDVNTLDPRNIRIFGNGGGMLPQSNHEIRPFDLIENAIEVKGASDGSFDQNDLIIFYAEGPDKYVYNGDSLAYEFNIYDRENYYFLNVGNTEGKRIESSNQGSLTAPIINSFSDFAYHEISTTNLLISGRDWFGEKFDLTTEHTIDFNFDGIKSDKPVKVTSNVMAQAFNQSSFDLFINNTNIGEQHVESVPDFNQKAFRYSIKGRESTERFVVNASEINNPNNIEIKIRYNKGAGSHSIGFLDNLLIEVERDLRWYNATTIFRSLESTQNVASTFTITNADSDINIWEITDQSNITAQQFNLNNGIASFQTNTDELKEFVLFKVNNIPAPNYVKQVANQNIKALSTPDLLIVAHNSFVAPAQKLAAFRESNDNLSTQVVTTEQIFNEFSSGKQDVSAIRDYAKHLFDKSNKLKFLLLIGRGSYDYLDNINNNTNFVPIYESRNSLHPLKTYGSDDFYGFLEDEEGEWNEDPAVTHTLDIGIGRLPVANINEANEVVDKIINYSTNKNSFGDWRNVVTFVADDGDFNLHQRQSDQLTRLVDTSFQVFNPDKLYLDAFEQVSKPSGEVSPAASEALDNAVNDGALIVNFTGHGGEAGWMQEQVLDLTTIRNWQNKDNLPLFVTATCEFSRHDDPRRVSGGELVLTNPEGGGIAIVSTCRPVSSSSNFELNKAFYNNIFTRENNDYLRLGDVFRLTKNNPDVNAVGNRNFALLGDPSLKLNYPSQNIKFNSITKDGIETDTIHALSLVKVTGEVENNGTTATSFNGTLYAVVYDKEVSFTTLGNENSPFNYYAKENVIFKGKATVTNGMFDFDFIVPKNISYQIDQGKISLYAVNNDKTSDAGGATYINIGGSSNKPSTNQIGPNISLYLGDTLNQSLVDIPSNTVLIAKLQDNDGINLSGYGVGNNITATLDDSTTYIMNNYYQAETDTYQKGWVNFPIKKLKKGEHSIIVKAWDTQNNSSEAVINFIVADPNKLNISSLLNYPNPFSESTTFSFRHNRAGEDLEISLDILNSSGQKVGQYVTEVENSNSNVIIGNWTGNTESGEKLNNGIYLYKLTVRSKKDGALQHRQHKLILIN
ncbi:MAG: type IX secretion system sortase PorU [Fulvivirga sp.]